jgi:hypothetical protein
MIGSRLTSSRNEKLNWHDAKDTLKDGKLWLHYVTYLCAGCGIASLSLFSPVIVAGLGYADLKAQLFTVPPYAVAYVTTIAMAFYSDHKKMRGPIASASYGVAAVAFLILGK